MKCSNIIPAYSKWSLKYNKWFHKNKLSARKLVRKAVWYIFSQKLLNEFVMKLRWHGIIDTQATFYPDSPTGSKIERVKLRGIFSLTIKTDNKYRTPYRTVTVAPTRRQPASNLLKLNWIMKHWEALYINHV